MKILDKLKWYFDKRSLPYWCILLLDSILCFLSGLFVFWLFFRGQQTLGNILPVSRTLLLYMVFNVIAFRVFHTYSGIIRYSSFVDLKRVAYAMALACFMVWLIHYPIVFWKDQFVFVPLKSRHIFSIYIISVLALWTMRVLVKSVYEAVSVSNSVPRILIYGVLDGGVGLAKDIRTQRPAKYLFKGFISHGRRYKNKRLMGEKVYQTDELPHILKSERIQKILVSPNRNDDFRNDQKLQTILAEAHVGILMMPQASEWKPGEDVDSSMLKEVNIDDLLPRDEIEVDMEKIGEMIAGKKILITGSAGSIGSELVKQISYLKPAKLMLIDQAETPQHDIRLMLRDDYPEINTQTVVTSISNKSRMESIFDTFRPDYVFHAAAYKHVPMMEDNPSESIQNNVYGTQVIADLSVKYGVKKFVMISTDKAVNPTNVMGCSKRICEIYVQSLDKAIKDGKIDGVTQFVTTRFGNVLGSNGSVIPLFEKQIKAGGPITVTDPDVIRYFMLIPEACRLVLEAGVHGNGGEIFVFDMGKPVRIADLAKQMISLSGAYNVEIKYTGLRPGEKLFEEVLSSTEDTLPSFNKKIRIAKVREYDYDKAKEAIEELMAVAESYDDVKIVEKMKEIVPEYIPNNSRYSQLDN
ncbi:MAG: polysaccharide biosynthesis protein [Prevotella sp.]|nr:polysaccharide biosynthesis protein [Prevotella sp.]